MLKNRYVFIALFLPLVALRLTAQPMTDEEGRVGIGTDNPDKSAILDLSSSTGGLLVPRMSTVQRDLIENPATGLMLYNRTTKAFEFNIGTAADPSWKPIGGGGNGWGIEGNSETNPASSFLGTTDNQPIVFRTNNAERMRLTNSGLMPGTDDTYDLGSLSSLWRDIYVGPGSLHIVSNNTEADWTLSIDEGESPLFRNLLFNLNGTTRMALSGGGDLTVPSLGFQREGESNLVLVDGSGELLSREPGGVIDDYAWMLEGNTGTDSSTNFLGTTDAQGLSIRTNDSLRVLVTSDGNTLPGADNTYDLGTPTVRWQDVHLGPGSLHIHSTAAEADSAHDWSLGIIGSGTGQGALQIAEDGNGVMTINSQGNLGVGAADPAVRADIDGGLAIRPPAVVEVTSSATVTVGNRSYIRVESDGFNLVTLSDGLQDGQILVIQCLAECDSSNELFDGFELDTDNIVLDRDHNGELYTNDTVTLIWDDSQGKWIMLSHTDTRCPTAAP